MTCGLLLLEGEGEEEKEEEDRNKVAEEEEEERKKAGQCFFCCPLSGDKTGRYRGGYGRRDSGSGYSLQAGKIRRTLI